MEKVEKSANALKINRSGKLKEPKPSIISYI